MQPTYNKYQNNINHKQFLPIHNPTIQAKPNVKQNNKQHYVKTTKSKTNQQQSRNPTKPPTPQNSIQHNSKIKH